MTITASCLRAVIAATSVDVCMFMRIAASTGRVEPHGFLEHQLVFSQGDCVCEGWHDSTSVDCANTPSVFAAASAANLQSLNHDIGTATRLQDVVGNGKSCLPRILISQTRYSSVTPLSRLAGKEKVVFSTGGKLYEACDWAGRHGGGGYTITQESLFTGISKEASW